MPATIAVMGAGPAARHHLLGLVRSPHCDRVVLAAPDSPARAELYRRFGIIKALHDEYSAALADPDVNIVDVCAPITEREAIIREALKAGKHVVTAAPFATTAEASEALAQQAASSKLRLLPVLYQRFIPANARVKQLLSESAIGAPIFGGITRIAPQSDEPETPAILQDGFHAVELLQHFFGPAQAGSATTNPTGSLALLTLQLPEGVLAQVNVVAAATGDHPATERRLVGTEGSLLVRDNPEDELPLIAFQGEEAFPIRVKNHPDVVEYAVMENLGHLLQCLATSTPEDTTAAQATAALVTIRKATR
ncbi:MAG: Gfo/Idh/MocA family oxidoreductase [Armatimonadia bacterium]